MNLGQMDRALGLALAAEAEFRARHDAVNRLAALNVAGAAQFELGDLEGAESRFSDLLELAGERGDDEMLGRATNNLASLASLRGDHERALSLFQLATTAYQKVGFRFGLAQAAHNLGIVYRDLGYWRESDRHYSQALRRARQLGDKRLAAMARVGRSEVFFLRGDRELAGVEARHALESFRVTGDELGRADALRLLGQVAMAGGEHEEAARCLDEALRLAREHQNPLLEAETLEARSELQGRLGRNALAHADLEVAAAIYRRLGAVKRQQQVEARLQ